MQRRDVLRLTLLAVPLVGCGSEAASSFTCGSVHGLSTPEAAMRMGQEYVDRSGQPDRTCANCRYYTPAPAGECGACQLLRGPIHPEGYCNLWTGRA